MPPRVNPNIGANGAFPIAAWAPMAYNSGVSRKLITVAETPLFARQSGDVWDEAEREEFIDYIAWNPEAGDLIPETGGVRKLRWTRKGSGKRGGVRVVYFYHRADRPLYLLMVYAKSRKDDLTPDEKRAVRRLTEELKR